MSSFVSPISSGCSAGGSSPSPHRGEGGARCVATGGGGGHAAFESLPDAKMAADAPPLLPIADAMGFLLSPGGEEIGRNTRDLASPYSAAPRRRASRPHSLFPSCPDSGAAPSCGP